MLQLGQRPGGSCTWHLQLSAAITLVTKLMAGSSLNKRKASSAVLA